MKRKVKQWWERNAFLVGIFIWAGLLSTIIACFAEKKIPNMIGVVATIVTAIYTVIGIVLLMKSVDKMEEQEAEERKKLLKELKAKYASYISLVDEEISKVLDSMPLKMLDSGMVSVSTNLDYLKAFYLYQKHICEYKIVGTPDTFILASCLMWALMKNHTILVKDSYQIELQENTKLAIQCALKLISKPSTYYENEKKEWVEEKHPEVEIVIPKGLIKNSDLSLRIQNSLISTTAYGGDTIPIMQTSDMLHLLYLYCQKNRIQLRKRED